MDDTIHIIDTTLRDGQQSLWACRMRTAAMLPALPDLDSVGFDAMEFTVPSILFPRAVKDLKENPWDWLSIGTSIATKTPKRLHGGAGSRFLQVPECVQELFLSKLVEMGITTTRTSDPWNNYDDLIPITKYLSEHGIKTVVNVIYSESPRHTLDYFAAKTREAVAMDPYRICFKDVGGLLTPFTAAEVMPVIVKNAGDVPIEFHAHSNNGFAPYVALMAAEHGMKYIHTAVPPLANGAGQPSIFKVVPNLRARGMNVDVDLEPLHRVSEHFYRVAEHDDLPVGRQAEYDESLYTHQIPGGMISNLHYQMQQVGVGHRLDEALEEAARARRDLGYPIMVTPLAQFVGSQAVLNVVTGSRYGTVTDEIIRYAMGEWGREAITAMDPEVRALILDRPRAREIEEQRSAPEPTLDEVRARFPDGTSDEEMLVRILSGVGTGEVDFSNSAGGYPRTYDEYVQSTSGLLGMLKKATQSPSTRRFEFAQGADRVRMVM